MSRERSLSWASPAFGAIRPIGSWWATSYSVNSIPQFVPLRGRLQAALMLRATKSLAAARSPSYKHREPQSFFLLFAQFRRIPMRPSRRAPDELRAVSLERGVVKYAEGSCMVKFGDTHVLVTATLEERLPPWLKGQGRGWVTAEYGMLPRATLERTRREASAGKQNGRTVEIQRLIGRSLRATLDLEALGERQITVDCDVLQADGGTRTASITGAWVALALALKQLVKYGALKSLPLRDHLAATSVGIVNGEAILDLCYEEDSRAEVDMNIVMTGDGRIIEVQGTAEKTPFSQDEFLALMELARKGVARLVDLQKMAVA